MMSKMISQLQFILSLNSNKIPKKTERLSLSLGFPENPMSNYNNIETRHANLSLSKKCD